MKVGDLLYFAPNVGFDAVDFNSAKLAEHFYARIDGFYIRPALVCVEQEHAFAAGVLLVSCIDALARLRYGGAVGARFRKFAKEDLSSFSDEELAKRLYDECRNGIVHEARLKEGCQFSLFLPRTVCVVDGLLIINPRPLAHEVRAALDSYMEQVRRDSVERARLANALRTDFKEDLRAVGRCDDI